MFSSEAEALNRKLNPLILNLLSDRGKAAYFPKAGIVAQSAEAAGKRINATIGIATKDDGSPMTLPSTSSKVSLPTDAFAYASTYGKQPLRTLWREAIYRKNPSLEAPVSVPIVVQGLTNGLSTAAAMFVNDGDSVIIADKSWENYDLIFRGAIDRFSLLKGDGLDMESFRNAVMEGWGKKIILLNFPNNPTGYSPSYAEAMSIVGIIREAAEAGSQIVVIIDDAYFGFFYEDCFRESLFALLADVHKNVLAVKVDGSSKEQYAWGLRVGFLTYGLRGATEDDYRSLEDKTAGIIRASISSASNLSQSLMLDALRRDEGDDNFHMLQSRYEKVKHAVSKRTEYFRPLPFNSGYFMCIEVENAEAVRQLLLKKYNTGVIAFGNLLRIAFSSVPEDKIDELFDNIYKACRDLSNPLLQLMDEESFAKLEALGNPYVSTLIEKCAKICRPSSIRILSDSHADAQYVREKALHGEESDLTMDGHTVHFDGMHDQGRDKEKTKIFVRPGQKLDSLNTIDRAEGLREIHELMEGSMEGREMLVQFYCLGPPGRFALPAFQMTDSAYVIHSENILYRNGYEQFKTAGDKFFHFLHSSGELEDNVSKNPDKKRIYIDLEKNRVFSVNTQYAGNSVGLKKLALRLAINKANSEGWLAEHMFLMGVLNKGRKTYFCGAFPSACGKTSTAMVPGNTIVGDDIAYLRKDSGRIKAVNIEQGIFGIIQDVNPVDDPLIHQTLTTQRELIFSNVLVHNGRPHWLGMGEQIPDAGINYSGYWTNGKTVDGNEVLPAHKNARYTMRIEELENADENMHNPEGVPVEAIIYGGRDSDTSPPVLQSFDWRHGVFLGASLESETTAATTGAAGVRKIDPMAIHDFLVVPLGKYLANHLRFGDDDSPIIFTTNYFLKDGSYLNDKVDKKVWLLWMESRVHGEYETIKTPIGFIPKYEDLKDLFMSVLDKHYSKEDYEKQFSLRVSKLLQRLERVDLFYLAEDVPEEISLQIDAQRTRLINVRREFKKDVISPFEF